MSIEKELSGMTRRTFIGSIGALALSPLIHLQSAKTQELENTIYYAPESPTTPDQIERDTNIAIDTLIENVDSNNFDGSLDFVKNNIVPQLQYESGPQIPTGKEIQHLVGLPEALELFSAITNQSHGLFLDGVNQALYVIKRNNNKMEFIKKYVVSTSSKEWDTEYGTPRGLMHIGGIHRKGILGQDISEEGANINRLMHVSTRDNKELHFVTSIAKNDYEPATLITESFQIIGSNCKASRGIKLHGTNRSLIQITDTNENESLLGKRSSGGCVRMSNINITDIAQYITVGKLNDIEDDAQDGTPLYVYGKLGSATSNSHIPPHYRWQDIGNKPKQESTMPPRYKY